jgi:endonuclease/exonuclease/phosphatase (EEP) superfamily protein YafD
MFICVSYITHQKILHIQSFENDLFELIENDLSLFSENGSVIIMGDMNTSTV